jgi:hypothetical protein
MKDVLVVVTKLDGTVSRGCIAEASTASSTRLKVVYISA